MNKQQAILERINKDNRNKEEVKENEVLAEQYTSNLKTQKLDEEVFEKLDNRLREGKHDIRLLEVKKIDTNALIEARQKEIRNIAQLQKVKEFIDFWCDRSEKINKVLYLIDNLIKDSDEELDLIKFETKQARGV